MMPLTAGAQARSNAKWIAVAQIVRVAAQFASMGVLAYLLGPAQWGTAALATVVANLALIFRDLGTAAAVVREQSPQPSQINSLYWFNIGLGITIWLMCCIAAAPAASFLAEPILIYLIPVLSLSFPVASAGIVPQALLERKSQFKLLSGIEACSAIAGVLLAIAAALLGAGAFSLAIQSLTVAISSSILLLCCGDYKPGLAFDWVHIRRLWRFSSNLVAFNLVNYLARNADSAIIGRFLGHAALGVYSLGYKIMLFPVQNLTFLVNRAMLPVNSQLQDDPSQIGKMHLRASGLIAFLSAPCMAGLWSVRELLVSGVFGTEWSGVAALLAWLAPVGFIQSLVSLTGAVLIARGKTDVLFRLGFIGTALLIPAFLYGVQQGLVAVAYWYFVANCANLALCIGYLSRSLAFSLIDFFKAISGPAICALGMAAIVVAIEGLLAPHLKNAAVRLAIECFAGAAIYLALSVIFARESLSDLIKVVRSK